MVAGETVKPDPIMPQEPASAAVARDKRASRRRRRLVWSAAIVAALLLFCFFGLPPIIRAQAVKHLSAALHRDVSIERIRINPLVLSVAIEGLAIRDRDGGPFTSWERLYVNFDSFSFFTGQWRFQEVALDGFSQHVSIEADGRFNFSDLISPASAEPVAAPEAPAKPPRPVRIENLSIRSARVSFADASRPAPFASDVGPLSFTLTNFLTVGDPQAPYEFSAVTESGETFAWKGTVSLDPVRLAGEFSVGGISLKKYAPYYADRINADLLDGLLDVSAHHVVDLSEGAREISLTGAALKLSRLQVAARGSTEPVIDLPSFVVEGLSADVVKTAVSVRRIALDGGHVTAIREKDGSLNLINLFAPPAGGEARTASAQDNASSPLPATAPPDVRLEAFAVSGVSIDIEDRTTPTPARNGIGRLDVSLQDFSLAEAAAAVPFKMTATLLPGGEIGIEGTVTREPLAADLAIKLGTLPLVGVTPYVEPFLNLRIAGGLVSVEGKAGLADGVVRFQGDATVAKFITVDGKSGEDFVRFSTLAVKGIDAASQPVAVNIGSIALADPVVRIAVNADGTTNLAAVLRSETAGEQTDAPAEASSVQTPAADAGAAPAWELGGFSLSNGALIFADHAVKPSVRIALDHFTGTVAGLSSAAPQQADVDISGRFNGGGRIQLTGKLDARALTTAPDARTELVLDVKDVDLSPISPYIGTYAGYELTRSGLAVDVKANVARRKLDTANVVTLKQFTLGAPTNSPVATKLPVRLGVALLKDMNGDIVIDLPVQGDLDDPNFRIGRVVLRVIGNLLVRAATSPFSLLGAAFGGGGEELAFQQFEPGATVPAGSEAAKLDTLRKALKGRPALNLEITGSYDAEADLAAVREQILMKQVRFRLWEELRAKNPDTPPPAELGVTPEDEARIIGLFVAERYPEGPPVVAADGSVPPPPPLLLMPKTAEAETPTRPLQRRAQRVSGVGAGAPANRDQHAQPGPVTFAPEGAAAAPSEDGTSRLTLADARRALKAGIPVPDDDLRQLASERAQRVRETLLAENGIEEGRLLLSPPAAEPKGAKVFLQLR